MVISTKNLFGEQLKGLRLGLGLSQGAMATKIGLALSSYQNLEAGKTTRIEIEKLIELGGLGMDVAGLLNLPSVVERSSDASELVALRRENKHLIEAAQHNVKIYGETLASRSRLQEQNEVLRAERDRLYLDNQTLRAQAAAATLSREEARLIAEVAESLGVPGDRGLLGVLERVRANLASVGALSPPTIPEGEPVQKSEGDGGGTEEESAPPRANSSS